MKIKILLIKFFLVIAGRLPLRVSRAIGAGLGRIGIALNTRAYRTTKINIQSCFPDMPADKVLSLSKSSMLETGKIALELANIWRRDQYDLKNIIHSIQGEELLIDAIKHKKGVVLLAPHIGNWEILGKIIPTYAPMTNLYQPPKQKYFEEILKTSREIGGSTTVPTNSRGVATILKRLKLGELTGILPDQIPEDGSGELINFFGIPAYTMTLVHGLIQRTSCKVVMVCAKRVSGGFELIFSTPDDAIYATELKTSLQALNNSIEQVVLTNPEQYQWEYKRFRKRLPSGERPVNYR